jgi:hypothetical protein
MRRQIVPVVLGALYLPFMLSACAGTGGIEDIPPDLQYGHRFGDVGPMGRITKYLTEPTTDEYFLYPVHVDSVTVRYGRFVHGIDPDIQRVAADVVLMSAFPEDCYELHSVEQRRVGHYIEVDFMMRKPRDVVCNRVRIPFRHYFVLDGSFRPGHYTMKINSRVTPFQVRPYR